ncbi:MAG: putative Ig domain-containing protein [Coriobacteriia bacterium]|nr:putative Ig domain-containing protein [Coriobacteriia bacterium]
MDSARFDGRLSKDKQVSPMKKALCLGMTLLLAVSLTPAMSLSAFADELDAFDSEAVASNTTEGAEEASGAQEAEAISEAEEVTGANEAGKATPDLESNSSLADDTSVLDETEAAEPEDTEAFAEEVILPLATTRNVSNYTQLQNAWLGVPATGDPTTINLTANITLPARVSLNIPAHRNIILTSNNGSRLIGLGNPPPITPTITVNGRLTIDGSIVITQAVGQNSLGVWVFSGGTLAMRSGTITGNSGGGVSVDNNATFTMTGGTISNNGHGVKVSDSTARFTFTAGTISGNNTGVICMNGGRFTMNGGTITKNLGIGVNIHAGSFTMSGGSITNNDNSGVSTHGSFTMTGGTISGNYTAPSSAGGAGGGVYIARSGSLSMSGGTITRNGANGGVPFIIFEGGGIYSLGTLSLSGTARIENNKGSSGGGIAIFGGTGTISGAARVENNNASVDGGGVCINGGSLSISGGSFIGNSATRNGGAISVANYANLKTSGNSGIVFRNNSTPLGYFISTSSSDYTSTYLTNIRHSPQAWSAPFTYGYNNYDISYTGGTQHGVLPPVVTKPTIVTQAIRDDLNLNFTTSYSQTLSATGTAPITWSIAAGSLPPGLSLSNGGVISGTLTTRGTYNFTVRATNSAGSDTKALRITIEHPPRFDYWASQPSLAALSKPYTRYFSPSGVAPITMRVTSGSLPPGLVLSTSGVLSGIPTTVGVYNFTITATNIDGSGTVSHTLTITAKPIITSPDCRPEFGRPYSVRLAAVGIDPITWSLVSGSLPAGLTLSSAGVISGTPRAEGSFNIEVRASNSAGSDTKALRIVVRPIISTNDLVGGTVGTSYKQTLVASSNNPVTWSASLTNLPPGLSLSSDGVLTGKPTVSGTYRFVVYATGSAGSETRDYKYFTITIKDPEPPQKPKITSAASLQNGIVGASYKKTLAATGAKTIKWTRASGSLPPGLSLSSAGVLSGKPTKPGAYSFIVKAANGAGSTTKTFTVTITQKPKITTTVASVHAGITGINYKKTLKATGTGAITWSRISGSLPPGLKLSSAGVITGKPTKPGTYNFKVRATNSIGNTTKTFTIKVNNPSISISYQTHVQSIGWQAFKKDGAMSGTSGKALRLEGIKINLKNNTGISGGISYSTHVQSIGWQKKVSLNTNGKSLKDVKGPMSGTSGKALRLEAITIELTGDLKKHYDIYYRVHAQKVGWMGWARNGEQAGTAGHAYRLEGIQIVLVPKVGGKKPGNTFKGITTPANTKSFIKK